MIGNSVTLWVCTDMRQGGPSSITARTVSALADQVEADGGARPVAVVPVIYGDRTMGALLACSDDPQRVWQENEILFLRTVADQVTVTSSFVVAVAGLAETRT